jgi:hypothetical protein
MWSTYFRVDVSGIEKGDTFTKPESIFFCWKDLRVLRRFQERMLLRSFSRLLMTQTRIRRKAAEMLTDHQIPVAFDLQSYLALSSRPSRGHLKVARWFS